MNNKIVLIFSILLCVVGVQASDEFKLPNNIYVIPIEHGKILLETAGSRWEVVGKLANEGTTFGCQAYYAAQDSGFEIKKKAFYEVYNRKILVTIPGGFFGNIKNDWQREYTQHFYVGEVKALSLCSSIMGICASSPSWQAHDPNNLPEKYTDATIDRVVLATVFNEYQQQRQQNKLVLVDLEKRLY